MSPLRPTAEQNRSKPWLILLLEIDKTAQSKVVSGFTVREREARVGKDLIMKHITLAAALSGAALLVATPAQATLVFLGQFAGNDCVGGFSTCYATQTGVVQGSGSGGSPAIFKYNNGGTTDTSTLFPSIDGSEFAITYDGGTNVLSFTYTPGANDPIVHYFTMKQANGYILFYDSDPITSGSVDLDPYFRQKGFSHITFFDTGAPAVPEPATWAMMLGGLGLAGVAMRRRKTVVSFA
jgi:hypothetical protein